MGRSAVHPLGRIRTISQPTVPVAVIVADDDITAARSGSGRGTRYAGYTGQASSFAGSRSQGTSAECHHETH
jgi:hypothetical protein